MPFHYELVELVLFSLLIKEEVRVWGVGMVERVKANWRKEKWASACFLCTRVRDCQWINDDVSRCTPRLLGGAFFAQRIGLFQTSKERFEGTGRRVGRVYSSVCLKEGKIGASCRVVENAHDKQSEFNEDGGLCNCRGQRWRSH